MTQVLVSPQVCIKRQREAYPDMDWRVVDVTAMADSFSEGEFDVVVEKATVDAFVANERSQWEVGDAAAHTIHKALKVSALEIIAEESEDRHVHLSLQIHSISLTLPPETPFNARPMHS